MSRRRNDRKRVRVRSCALILEKESLLLVRLNAPTRPNEIWMPPGGEVEPGETIREAVVRETQEETGLQVRPVRLSLLHEFLSPPYFAVEYYWLCERISGEVAVGMDPDRDGEAILTAIRWIPLKHLGRHPVFPLCLRTGMDRYGHPNGDIELERSDERRE